MPLALILLLSAVALGVPVCAQGPPAGAGSVSASALLSAVSNSPGSVTPARAVSEVLGASGVTIAANSSWELFSALQRDDDITVIEIGGDMTLDGEEWSEDDPVKIRPGRVVILRSQLNPDNPDVFSSPDALQKAGAASLNFAQRAPLIIAENGSLLALDGLILTNSLPLSKWTASPRSEGLPRGLGLNPGIICMGGCLMVHHHLFTNYFQSDCSLGTMHGTVYRGGILLGNTSVIQAVNDTAYAVTGPAAFDIHLIYTGNQSNEDPGQAHVVVEDVTFNCNVDATPQPSPQAEAASSSSGGGTPAWVWAVVAVAVAAGLAAVGAAAFVLWRRRRQARRSPGLSPIKPGSSAGGSAGIVVARPGGGGTTVAESFNLGRLSPPGEDKDLEKGSPAADATPPSPCALKRLQETWSGAVGSGAHGLELLEPVGRGGFATVWRGRWNAAVVAVKLIEHGMCTRVLDSIQREAELSTSVSHPNVVATYKVITLSLQELGRLHPQALGPPSAAAMAQPLLPPAPPPPLRPPTPSAISEEGAQLSLASEEASQVLGSQVLGPASPTANGLAPATAAGSPPSAPSAPASASALASPSARKGPAASSSLPSLPEEGMLPALSGAQSLEQQLAEQQAGGAAGAGEALEQEAGALLGATLIVQELCARSAEQCMLDGQVLYWPDGSPDQVAILRMLIDCGQGLDYLHQVDIVHGDVKPANVLLAAAGGTRRGWVAKISDLGTGRMLPPGATSIVASAHEGTVAHMAPELLGQDRLAKAVDVYAFGILMYEVWSRRRAWPDMPMAQLIFAVVTESARPPVPEDWPEAYARLMQQCWSQEAADRPTFEAVLKSLQALLRELLQAGVPDTAGRKAQLSSPSLVAAATM